MPDSSPLDSLLETRPATRPSWPQLSPCIAGAQEPSCSSPTGTRGGDAGRVTLPEQSPARLEAHVTLIFVINQNNTVCQLLLFVVLSCPRLAVGWSWLPRPGTAVSTPGVCQRKKGSKLLCLPALLLMQSCSDLACSSSLLAAAAVAGVTRLGAGSTFSESSSQLPPQFPEQ